jgi:tRNA A37 threonylcarbamoyltransferase TsaD
MGLAFKKVLQTQPYPTGLLEQAIRQSNNLSHMSAIAVTQLPGNAGLGMAIVELAKSFPDYLQLK